MMLVTILTGCGNKSTSTDTEATKLDPGTLTWYLHGSNLTDDSEVLAKANEYLKDKLNVTLKPIWGTWAISIPTPFLRLTVAMM